MKPKSAVRNIVTVSLVGLACSASAADHTGVLRSSVAKRTPVVGGVVDERHATVTATVRGVDSETGVITLRRRDGSELTMVVPPEVADLEQSVDAGDEVGVAYRESVAFAIEKRGTVHPGVEYTKDVTRPPHEERLHASVIDTVHVRTAIAGVEPDAGAVVVRNPQGDLGVVKLPDRSALDAVVVGDVMDMTQTKAVDIKIRKAAH